jgi:mycothiol synthase
MIMSQNIEIKNVPNIPGLKFRHFHGPTDFPKIAVASMASCDADQVEVAITADDIARQFTNLVNCDPFQDTIFAELDGELIGYSRGSWFFEANNGPYLYQNLGYVVPTWRRQGLGQVILQWMENRLRKISSNHPNDRAKYFQAYATQDQTGRHHMLEKAGYHPVRYYNKMVRPTLDNIPNFSLTEGVALRPVLPEHYRTIWEVLDEVGQDHWGYAPSREEYYQAWLSNKHTFQPHLWQVAWDIATDQVAGHVLTYILHAENEKYDRKRGYTEAIGVRRPWRRKGLARALIARSLQVQKEQGMTESALGVDSENLSGATRIYEDCGFQVIKRNTIYRKSLCSKS